PFDLLCYLIENAEMNIYDIQVSQITNSYLSYMEEMRMRDPALGGEFMVLAASLIELKSKMLLPRTGAAAAGADEDPRSELVTKLLLYRKFKEAAAFLSEREERAALLFEKPAEDLQAYTNEQDAYLRMEPARFARAFRAFLTGKQRMDEIRRHYARTENRRETAEARMSFIKALFARKRVGRLRFWELLRHRDDRAEKVVTFVALLEMIRNKTVRARQRGSFAEITVELCDAGETTEKGAVLHAE
ncbi:MAG: segregation/condensation protein A, partial [Clostridiales Family XIII bacterium]|nr:segregation/condensation protein A [Clostridiales Family XIII bacterium]